MKPLRVNLLGGRDVGKTTIAMHAAAELRWLGLTTTVRCGLALTPVEGVPDVVMEVVPAPGPSSPHEAAEACRGALNFLVLRRKDYYDRLPGGGSSSLEVAVNAVLDKRLEETLRSGHVRYKSLPGCRASVQYVIKRVCEKVGYGK